MKSLGKEKREKVAKKQEEFGFESWLLPCFMAVEKAIHVSHLQFLRP